MRIALLLLAVLLPQEPPAREKASAYTYVNGLNRQTVWPDARRSTGAGEAPL